MAYKAEMKRDYRPRSGVALGGIGTGGIELRKDGLFYNWNIFNNYPFGTGKKLDYREDSMLFFTVRYQEQGKKPKMKLLQIEEGLEIGGIWSHPQQYIFPWLSGVDKVSYEATYPIVKLLFSDEEMPFEVEMTAWSPFIPGDVKNSSLPGVIFDFNLIPKSNNTIEVMIIASMRSAVGYDIKYKTHKNDVYNFEDGLVIEATCEGMDTSHSSFGYQALSSLSKQSSYYLGWSHNHPYYETVLANSTLTNFDDTKGRNNTKDKGSDIEYGFPQVNSSIATSTVLTGTSFKHTFIYSWNFPNLYSHDKVHEQGPNETFEGFEGNYYSNFFNTSVEVALYIKNTMDYLKNSTFNFNKNFYDSSLEEEVLDQINSQLNTFVTSSWLTKDMNFAIEEGLTSDKHWGPLGTIDVAMYASIATAALFPELDMNMMGVHKKFQQESGSVCHGFGRSFFNVTDAETNPHRLDMPSQFVVLALRAYLWSGNTEYIEEVWPAAKKALEYVLRERDHNKDCLPDMEGIMCSYDNFPMYGASSFIGCQWLSAVNYAVETAKILGDKDAVAKYESILEKGKLAFEEKLWNGSYYRLYNDENGKNGGKDEGCLTDQLLGQLTNHYCGLGHLLNSERIKMALSSIMKLSYSPEYGVANCRWPEDAFLHPIDKDIWVDQANTCWTGVEFALASLLIYEGLVNEGMEIIKNVDKRYKKFGLYWNHLEFGGHYYRAMSAWGIVNASLGLSKKGDSISFSPKLQQDNLKLFFAIGKATGHYEHNTSEQYTSISIHSGYLKLSEISIGLTPTMAKTVTLKLNNEDLPCKEIESTENGVHIVFESSLLLDCNDTLEIRVIM